MIKKILRNMIRVELFNPDIFLDSLPATAYVKMIDIWLIFAISIPFCEVNSQYILESMYPI